MEALPTRLCIPRVGALVVVDSGSEALVPCSIYRKTIEVSTRRRHVHRLVADQSLLQVSHCISRGGAYAGCRRIQKVPGRPYGHAICHRIRPRGP